MLIDGVLLAAGVHLVATPLFGAPSDRLGRRPVYLVGMAAVTITAVLLAAPSCYHDHRTTPAHAAAHRAGSFGGRACRFTRWCSMLSPSR